MSLSTLVPSWPWLVAGALTSFVAYCNVPIALQATPEKATREWLAEAPLVRLDDSKATLKGSELWTKCGAVIMAVRRPG